MPHQKKNFWYNLIKPTNYEVDTIFELIHGIDPLKLPYIAHVTARQALWCMNLRFYEKN